MTNYMICASEVKVVFPKTTPLCTKTSAVNSVMRVVRAMLKALSSDTNLHSLAIKATGSPNASKIIASCTRDLQSTVVMGGGAPAEASKRPIHQDISFALVKVYVAAPQWPSSISPMRLVTYPIPVSSLVIAFPISSISPNSPASTRPNAL